MKRRAYIKVCAAAAGSLVWPARAGKGGGSKYVSVMSDIHVGLKWDGRDGAEWLIAALDDLDRNVPHINYALVLGDLTDKGKPEQVQAYLDITAKSRIPAFHALAGNHDNYTAGTFSMIRESTKPYCIEEGNVAIFMISDEHRSRTGKVLPESLAWLEENMERQKDKILIVCSHQMVADTGMRRSTDKKLQLSPQADIQGLLNRYPIALWMNGHEHHAPYSKDLVAVKNGTTFANIASVSHAKGTESSSSYVLELVNGARSIQMHRRDHDRQAFVAEYAVDVPLNQPLKIS